MNKARMSTNKDIMSINKARKLRNKAKMPINIARTPINIVLIHEIGSNIVVKSDSMVKNLQARKLTWKKLRKYMLPEKTADKIKKKVNFYCLKAISFHVIIHDKTSYHAFQQATECI